MRLQRLAARRSNIPDTDTLRQDQPDHKACVPLICLNVSVCVCNSTVSHLLHGLGSRARRSSAKIASPLKVSSYDVLS